MCVCVCVCVFFLYIRVSNKKNHFRLTSFLEDIFHINDKQVKSQKLVFQVEVVVLILE